MNLSPKAIIGLFTLVFTFITTVPLLRSCISRRRTHGTADDSRIGSAARHDARGEQRVHVNFVWNSIPISVVLCSNTPTRTRGRYTDRSGGRAFASAPFRRPILAARRYLNVCVPRWLSCCSVPISDVRGMSAINSLLRLRPSYGPPPFRYIANYNMAMCWPLWWLG
jgi:hypothetical protein